MKFALIYLKRKVDTRVPNWTDESQKPPIEKWLEDKYIGRYTFYLLFALVIKKILLFNVLCLKVGTKEV